MNDPAASVEDRRRAVLKAADRHQELSRDASCGRGVDRHLFALYVVSIGLGKDIPFLKDALSIPWRLSTSQIPQRQTEGLVSGTDESMVSPSGGFGPVADDGYGVSYMMASDDQVLVLPAPHLLLVQYSPRSPSLPPPSHTPSFPLTLPPSSLTHRNA